MPEKRFFLDEDIVLHSTYSIKNEEAQHVKVMRCRVGDHIELINGKGILAEAKIDHFSKQSVEVTITSLLHEQMPKVSLTLVQALPRLNRLDTILEKCTELGATNILLFPGELSEKKELSENQIHRIENILISASKQCGRLFLPFYNIMPALNKWQKPEGQLLYGDTSPEAPLLIQKLNETLFHVLFFVGPEQGFSSNEELILKSWGAIGVKLHSNILRTDTAPIAALSILSQVLLENKA